MIRTLRGQVFRRASDRERRGGRAFTLVEIVVVVGLIVLLVGGLSRALSDSGGSSLATAQKSIATMVGMARAQAAVGQTETVLAIFAQRPPAGDAEKFLRMLQVFRNSNPGVSPATWVPVGSPVSLPAGVYIVPPTTATFLDTGVTWPTNPPLVSSLNTPIALGQLAGTPFGTPATAYTIRFEADGSVTPVTQGLTRLIVGTAKRGTSGPLFINNAAVRGLLIRPTGAVTFVNEAGHF